MVLVSLMEDQESISGLSLVPFRKLVILLSTTVPVLTSGIYNMKVLYIPAYINQASLASIPPEFVGNGGIITSVIQAVKAKLNPYSMMKILCGMELVVGL